MNDGYNAKKQVAKLSPNTPVKRRRDLQGAVQTTSYTVERDMTDTFVEPPCLPPPNRRPYHLNQRNAGPNGLSHDYWNELQTIDYILSEPSLGIEHPNRVLGYYEHFREANKRYPGREDPEAVTTLQHKVERINQALSDNESLQRIAPVLDDIRILVFGDATPRKYS